MFFQLHKIEHAYAHSSDSIAKLAKDTKFSCFLPNINQFLHIILLKQDVFTHKESFMEVKLPSRHSLPKEIRRRLTGRFLCSICIFFFLNTNHTNITNIRSWG